MFLFARHKALVKVFMYLCVSALSWRIINKICGSYKRPFYLPFVGHLPFLINHQLNTLARWRQKYGDVYGIRLGSWTTIVLNGYRTISRASKTTHDAFSSRPPFLTQQVLKDLNQGQESLIFSEFDDSFLKHQKLTSSALRLFVTTGYDVIEDILDDETNNLVVALIDKCKSSNDGINVSEDIQLAIASISYKLLFGNENSEDAMRNIRDINSATSSIIEQAGVNNLVELMPFIQYVFPWKVGEYISNLRRISTIRDREIARHLRTFDETKVRDVIDAMLKIDSERLDGCTDGCSRERLLCTVQDFVGGGFATSTALMLWLVKYMAAYPDVQKRVRDEIDTCRDISYKDRANLPYTEAVIHEVLRMSCVLPFGLPHYATGDTQFGEKHINNDSVVIFNLHSVAFDKHLWGDPGTFRPERFVNADGLIDRNKCSRIPTFGFGRRRCIGESVARIIIFTLFTKLMQKCIFINKDNAIDFEGDFKLVYKPKPFRVVVQNRM